MDTKNFETFGRRLNRLRKARDLNQRSLADAAGMAFHEIAFMEADRPELLKHPVSLKRLARALGCSIEDLLPAPDILPVTM